MELTPTITRTSEYTATFSWSATTGTYYIWKDGWLEVITTELSWACALDAGVYGDAEGESVMVSVFDSATDVQTGVFPGRMWLTWYAVASAARYRIDQYVGSAWTEVGSVAEDGRGWYAWRSAFLSDATEYRFRVTAVGTNDVDGLSMEYQQTIVRHPSPPVVTYALNAGTRVVTVS